VHRKERHSFHSASHHHNKVTSRPILQTNRKEKEKEKKQEGITKSPNKTKKKKTKHASTKKKNRTGHNSSGKKLSTVEIEKSTELSPRRNDPPSS
jgi:hypothetical protein